MNRSQTTHRLLVAFLLLGLAACDRKGAPEAGSAQPAGEASAAVATGKHTKPIKYVPRPGGFPESEACKSCVQEVGVANFDCKNETGTAKDGPAAGVARQELCTDLLNCIYATKCAADDPIDCYCGTAGDACIKGEGNGVCRVQVERALETKEFNVVGARYGDTRFAGGVAMTRMDAARAKCGTLCGSR